MHNRNYLSAAHLYGLPLKDTSLFSMHFIWSVIKFNLSSNKSGSWHQPIILSISFCSNFYLISCTSIIDYLLNMCVEDTLGKNLLWYLGSHIGISKLCSNEYTSNFGFTCVYFVNFHLNSSLGYIECLVIFLEKFVIFFFGLKTWKSYSHIVSGGTTTSLRVKEKTGTVGRGCEISSHLKTWFEVFSTSFGNKVLDGEGERNAFTSRKLYCGRSVVNTFFFFEGNFISYDKTSLDSVKGVGLAGHNLRVDEFLFGLSSLSDFFLYCPCFWLNAHINKPLSSRWANGVLSDNLWASVSKTSSLNLQV